MSATITAPGIGARIRLDADLGWDAMLSQATRTSPQAHASAGTLARELEAHRRELTGYCYRMLGSGFEAEDAVQETFVRAWRKSGDLQSKAALRSWLYRIATNVCLDMVQGPQRRARPMDMGPASTADRLLDAGLPEHHWIQPIAEAAVLPEGGDPAALTDARESIRLAFVAALQHLPPRQRAVLILREVLRWQAAEVAELLDTSVASVNSALQRARATLDALDLDTSGSTFIPAEQQELLTKYVTAFESYDIEGLVSLLHEDAMFTMPPYELWLVGRDQAAAWMRGQGAGCEGAKVVPTRANGFPAAALYRVDPEGGWAPFNIVVLEIADGGISALHHFLYPELFEAFGLPVRFDAQGEPVYAAAA